MKKLLLLLILPLMPSFAACPIENNDSTVCSLPNFREQINPVLNENTSNTNINRPSLQLQPLNREDPIDQMRGPNNTLNYNSGCQFGVCLQDPKKNTLMQNQ